MITIINYLFSSISEIMIRFKSNTVNPRLNKETSVIPLKFDLSFVSIIYVDRFASFAEFVLLVFAVTLELVSAISFVLIVTAVSFWRFRFVVSGFSTCRSLFPLEIDTLLPVHYTFL